MYRSTIHTSTAEQIIEDSYITCTTRKKDETKHKMHYINNVEYTNRHIIADIVVAVISHNIFHYFFIAASIFHIYTIWI